MTRFMLPRHLGGTKSHPRQRVTDEERMLLKQRMAENDRQRAAQTAAKAAEKRARRYQVEDEERAYGRQVDLQSLQQDFERSMQGERYGYQSRLQEQGEQADLVRGSQQFGFQRQLGADEFRYDTIGRQQAGDIAAEAALEAFAYDDMLQEERLATQVGLAEFDAAQTGMRDERLHEFDLQGRQLDIGATRDRDFLQADLMRERDELLDMQARKAAEQEQVWEIGQELRRRGYDIDDRNFNREGAVELLKIESRLREKAATAAREFERRGVILDDTFKTDYTDYLRVQQQIVMGERFLPPNLQSKADMLRMEYGEILSSDSLSDAEKNAELIQNRMDLFDVYRGAQEVPAEQKAAQRDDFGRQFFGGAWDAGLSAIPFNFSEGKAQLPRGLQIRSEDFSDETRAAMGLRPVEPEQAEGIITPKDEAEMQQKRNQMILTEASRLMKLTVSKTVGTGAESYEEKVPMFASYQDALAEAIKAVDSMAPPKPAPYFPVTPSWPQPNLPSLPWADSISMGVGGEVPPTGVPQFVPWAGTSPQPQPQPQAASQIPRTDGMLSQDAKFKEMGDMLVGRFAPKGHPRTKEWAREFLTMLRDRQDMRRHPEVESATQEAMRILRDAK